VSLKTLSRKATKTFGRQMLTLQEKSPVLLFGIGIVGVTATAVLASRATLKLGDVLEKAEQADKEINDELTDDGAISSEHPNGKEWMQRKTRLRFQTAIEVAKLYAPSVIVGVASVGALTCSHIILRRRNVALASAYAVAQKGLDDYRNRVRKDQGPEKDREYMYGLGEREIVEETDTGPVVSTISGYDQLAIKNNPHTYARVFDSENKHFRPDIPNENQFFLNNIRSMAQELLDRRGYVFLNEVYDMLGFKPTEAGQVVGWVSTPKLDAEGNQENDCFIDFGVWMESVAEGKKWINGEKEAILLDFNVDGPILYILDKM